MNADDDVGFFLGVMLAEPENSRAGFSSGEVVEFFPGYTGDLETFYHGPTTASIAVDHVVVFWLVLIEDVDNELVSISISGQDKITAGDFQKFISGFQILNSDQVICNLDKKVQIQMEITIDKGRGYVTSEENKNQTAQLGTVFVDSIFTPIKNVKYHVEDFRVEQKTDYEKLVFDIVSDGSITPQDALTDAARILIHHFMLFSDERITLEADEIAKTETYDEESLHMRQLLKTKLIDMDLSVRALNCLKAAEVDTLGDLVSFNKNDLMKFRNFGKKSLTELEELVMLKGLSFGMDLSKYKLEKE